MQSLDDIREQDIPLIKAIVGVKGVADMHMKIHMAMQLESPVNVLRYPILTERMKRGVTTGYPAIDWQNIDENVEERLDRLRGGGFLEHQLAWKLFAEKSAYSPMRLSPELGWDPTPKGLPSNCDPSLFGWADAFEDLLAVSSARPMMTFERRQAMNEALHPIRTEAWNLYNRLELQGLGEVYFPVYSPYENYCTPRSMQEWAALRKIQTLPCDDWGRAAAAILFELHEFGGAPFVNFLTGSQPFKGGHTRENTREIFNAFGNMLAAKKGSLVGSSENGSGPQTEEDMYLSLKKAADDDKKPVTISRWSVLKRAFSPIGVCGSAADAGQQSQNDKTRQEETNTADVNDGNNNRPNDGAGNKGTPSFDSLCTRGKEKRVQFERRTEDGGTEVFRSEGETTLDGKLHGLSVEIQRRDKTGRVVSIEKVIAVAEGEGAAPPPPPLSSPFWRQFWENHAAQAGREKQKEGSDKESADRRSVQ